MIKPDGIFGNYSSVIKETVNNHGFSITQELFVQLNEDTVKSFYAEHSSKSFFSSLVEYMTRYFLALFCTVSISFCYTM